MIRQTLTLQRSQSRLKGSQVSVNVAKGSLTRTSDYPREGGGLSVAAIWRGLYDRAVLHLQSEIGQSTLQTRLKRAIPACRNPGNS